MKRLASSLLLAASVPAAGQIPAFPGAQGFGAHATGGRGGDVYYVTNLNNNGAGSLRAGLDTAPAAGRTIVFAVSGYIPVVSDTNFNVPSKVTIAGQTAPGDGVGLRGGRMLVSGSHVIMRHFRIRHGRNGTGGDCLNIASTAGSTMLDHISMMFSTDENFSFFNSSVNNFTMQYSNTSWGMERHNAGGLWDLQNGSCHHTLWAHHRTRNPKARPNGLLEWINNVTFHWRGEPFIMGDSQTPAGWKTNAIGNYYISIDDPDAGFGIRNTGFVKAQVATNGLPNFSLYLRDTLFDNNDNGLLDGTDRGYGIVAGSEFTPGDPVGANRYYKPAVPFNGAAGTAAVSIDDPTTAYKKVISSASPLRLDANYTGPLRDELDTLLVDSVVNQYSVLVQKDGKVDGEDPARTNNGEQLLADQYGITNNGFGTLNGTTPPTDVDLDGMPDFWEITLNGLDGMAFNVSGDDHNTVFTAAQLPHTFFPAGTPAGYTYLEEYLHFLAVPHATVAKNTASAPSRQMVDLRKFTDGFSSAPAFTLANVVNGTTRQFLADGVTPSATGPIVEFTPALNATGRAGFNFTVVDAEGSQWTQQFALLVSAAAAPRDLVWIGGGANAWDSVTPNWRTTAGASATFDTGDTALFDDRGSAAPAINISGTQTAGSVLVTGGKSYTLGGSGTLASTGSLTKAGDTTLTLATNTSFGSGTFLNGGETILTPAGNLAGGTIRFTGGSTLTSTHTDQDSNTLSLLPNLEVASGAVGNINLSKRVNVKGSLSGGGTFNIFSPSNLGTEGRVYLDGASAGCTGTVNLSGGATAPGNGGRVSFRANGGSFNGFGNAKVNLTGIDLFTTNNSGGNTYAIGQLGGDANARLRSNYVGGSTTWSVGGLNTSSTFNGIVMDGTAITNLTKTGSGTLTLSGANTYTGATSVNGGTLFVSGSLANTTVGIATGGTLKGNGAITGAVNALSGSTLAGAPTVSGLVTASAGATVSPGNNAGEKAVLTAAGGLTVTSGTLVFDLSDSPAGINDRIAVTGGSASLAGTQIFQINLADGVLGSGSYKLIDCSAGVALGVQSGMVMNLAMNAPAATRQSFGLQRTASGTAGGYVRLNVTGTAGELTWTGSTSIWDISNTTPWTGGPGGDNRFFNLDRVIFNDTAANRGVTLTGALQPRRIDVSNTGAAYTFGGDGFLAGDTALLKSGGGTLVIANTAANSFTGGTTIQGGTLNVTNTNSPLGTGAVTLGGGTLQLPNAAIFLPNSMVFSGSSAITSAYSGNLTVVNSTTATFSSSGEATVSLQGVAGILSINGRMDAFSGTITFGNGSGMLRLNSNSVGASDVNTGSSSAHFDLGGGGARLSNRNGNLTIALGALSGGPGTNLTGRQSGSGDTSTTYIIGAKNLSTTFDGAITNPNDLAGLNLIKTGSGNWTLGGNSSFTGTLAVENGAVTLTGGISVSGGVTTAPGATLSLAGGTLGAETANIEGMIEGYGSIDCGLTVNGGYRGRGFMTGVPGALGIQGDAFFSDAATLRLRVGNGSDTITVANDLNLAGTLQVQLAPGVVFGRFPLFFHGAALNLGQVSLTGIPAGLSAHLSTAVPGQVSLVIDDSDEDNLADTWEAAHFGNLTSGPHDDPDGDGGSNLTEFRLGLNPADASSAFRAALSGKTLVWPSAQGITFTVKRSLTLAGVWQTVGTVTGGAGVTASFTDSSSFEKAFYRVEFTP